MNEMLPSHIDMLFKCEGYPRFVGSYRVLIYMNNIRIFFWTVTWNGLTHQVLFVSFFNMHTTSPMNSFIAILAKPEDCGHLEFDTWIQKTVLFCHCVMSIVSLSHMIVGHHIREYDI